MLWNDLSDMTVEGVNNGLSILQNSFLGTWIPTNIYLANNAKILEEQGSEDEGADNCFADNVQGILIEEANPSSFFAYHYFDDSNGSDCNFVEPVTSQTVYFDSDVSSAEGDKCPDGIGSDFVIPPNPPHEIDKLNDIFRDWIDIVDPDCHPCIRDSIDIYTDWLIDAGVDNPLTYADDGDTENSGEYSNGQIAQYRKRFHLFMMLAIRYGILNEDYSYTETILLPYKQWYWQTRLYGFYMKTKQMTKANQLLNQLPGNTQDEQAFIRVQQINQNLYDASGQPIPYSATSTEISDLVSVAQSNNTSAAFAYGVYHKLTSDHISFDIPLPTAPIANQPIKYKEEVAKEFYPNPATDMITIANPQNIVSLDIVSLNGAIVKSIKWPGNTISVKGIIPGLYLIKIHYQDREDTTEKLVIE